METKNLLSALIEDFSTENLTYLFRRKTTAYRQIDEEANQLSNDFFSDALLLGEIKLENEDELIIYTFKTIKALTERSGKKAQYDLAKKILKQEQRYTAGFFIFYDDNNNFRLSLVYDIPQPNGKREWSNFKRFTYYVGKDQTNKTFLYRLDAADFSSLEKIKEAFSVEKVTKEFYTEIANWYFWALKNVKFPKDAEVEKNGKNIALIRFITRIIFIWFMKQKKLVSNALFDKDEIKDILKSLAGNESTYYKAILQNLFFATLNTPIKERKFRKDHSFHGKNKDYMVHNYYRFHSLFNNPDDMLEIFENIPFLNGGLFECLDKSKNDPSNDTGEEIRIDGFSDKENNQTNFPNILFFSDEKEVDLNKDYGTAKKKYKARGLINILQSYNFTIDENTPTDEEIALDPELLGRVFENLLASYNPETASTARKSTGSYYTPREIVNYMVDESLIAYLKNKFIEGAKSYIEIGKDQSDMFGNSARKGQLKIEEELKPSRWINNEDKLEDELRKLVSYSEDSISFTDKETDILINAINNCKILDPAVGSGAFPMGVLHKLVLILSKLDPHNTKWKQQQIYAIESNVTDPKLKRQLTDKIEENFNCNELDYGRKLYLIQNCLYGVDIQPIAIQISKLRFFISLLVDETSPSHLPEGKDGEGFDNYGIEPLPNLETKLVAANTLIGLPESLTLKPRAIEKLEDELFALRKRYFITSSETEKKTLEKNDREIREQLKKLLDENGFPSEFAEQISKWDPYNTNIASGWFNPEWMFGPDVKNGFNIVIANPPYIAGKSGLLSNGDKKYFNLMYETAEYQLDTYILFTEKGVKLLQQNGIISFIMPNTWLANIRLTKIRKFLLERTTISEILLMPDDVFLTAVVDTTVIFCCKNQKKNNAVKVSSFKNWHHNVIHSVIQDEFTKNEKLIFDIGINNSSHSLLNKIKKDTKRVRELCDVNRGVHAYRKDGYGKTKFGKGFQTEKDYSERSYHSDKKLDETYFKEVRGKNVFPYYFQLSSKYVSWGDWLAEPREWKYFQGERIYLRKIIGKTLYAAYVNGQNVADQSVYIAKLKKGIPIDTKFLLSLFNSELMAWYFRITANEFDDLFPQIKVTEFKELPIKVSFSINQKPFINLADQILSAKKQNPQADTKHLEDRIDIMVYKLYNLTYEEIKIINPEIEKIISKEDYEKFEIK